MSVARRLAIATAGFRGDTGGGSVQSVTETIFVNLPLTIGLDELPLEIDLQQSSLLIDLEQPELDISIEQPTLDIDIDVETVL